MSLRREFEKLIEKKEAEVAEKQREVDAAKAYIQALQDAIKKLPREDASPVTLRPGTDAHKIQQVLLTAGKPLHITKIIEELGRADEKDIKTKIAGILGWYVSKKKIFSRPGPNIYGLIDMPP